eukprot:g812.t1
MPQSPIASGLSQTPSAPARRPFRAERGLPAPPDETPPPATKPSAPTPSASTRGAAPSSPAEAPASLDAQDLAALREEIGDLKRMIGALQPQDADAGSFDSMMDADLAVRVEIARMVKMIGRAKTELAQIKHPSADTNRIEDARGELDAIVLDTGAATEEILGQAERQMDLLTRLAGALNGDVEQEALAAQIEEATIKIMEACNFQDLTGQRTSKVISTLRHIEERIVAMIAIWGIEAFEDLPIPENEMEGDAALLNGPARSGEGISQADIDALFD